MATLSKADQKLLSESQQKQILELKDAYAKATSDPEREAIHAKAEEIRATQKYSGGDAGNSYSVLPSNAGGRTAAEMEQALADYRAANTNYGSTKLAGNSPGWTNGGSTAMNVRSMANMVRQQMEANSQAWHTADEDGKEALHQENLKLAKLLPAESTYDPDTGKWSTWNTNLGYGADAQWTQENIANAWRNYYGYTDADREKWDKDTSHYYNFVDTRVPARNTVDESSGYTGQYAQFVNGPYAALRFGTRNEPDVSKYTDVYGDGFGNEEYVVTPEYDENGNIIKTAPALKNNNDMSAYTAQFAPAAVNGVLTGQGAKVNAMDPTSGSNNTAGQTAYYNNYGQYSSLRVPTASSGAGGYTSYLQQIYADALQAQLKALESGYVQNISELDASQKEVDALYKEQKRQVSGQSAQDSASWRELANAYGLGSGAVGQASLAQRNQLQSDLNKLNAAQASARTELERQRLLLGQQYQLAIEEAVAENNGALAKSLYEEAVRAEEALQQQQQFYANLALQYGKSMMSFAKSAGSGLSRVDEYNIIEDAVRNGYITDAQAMSLAQMFGFV